MNTGLLLYRSISADLTLILRIGRSTLKASRSSSCIPGREGGLRFRRDDGPGPACEDAILAVIWYIGRRSTNRDDSVARSLLMDSWTVNVDISAIASINSCELIQR